MKYVRNILKLSPLGSLWVESDWNSSFPTKTCGGQITCQSGGNAADADAVKDFVKCGIVKIKIMVKICLFLPSLGALPL